MTAERIELQPLGLFRVRKTDRFIELTLSLSCESGRYDYSKLYFTRGVFDRYSEDRVLCFKMRQASAPETIRLAVPPDALKSGWMRLRLEAFPGTSGRCTVLAARLVPEDGNALSGLAYLFAIKEWVRRQVAQSESLGRAVAPHPPESLSLELTAGCNFQCSHCSSHGDEQEHRMNNRRLSFTREMLDKLAHEVFPYLTLVNLVGRGEPTMVPTDLWNRLFELCETYRVLLTCVTNGSFVKHRFDLEKLRQLDTLTFSIDGMTSEVFAANRGGADLGAFMDNLAHFQSLRRDPSLLRPPRLGLSWTLKRNNIEQFPDFIEFRDSGRRRLALRPSPAAVPAGRCGAVTGGRARLVQPLPVGGIRVAERHPDQARRPAAFRGLGSFESGGGPVECGPCRSNPRIRHR